MKNMKRYGLIACAALVLALALFLVIPLSSTNVASYDNLIVNGDFSRVEDNGLPTGWAIDAYDGLTGAEFSVEQEADGLYSAHIINAMPKDARFMQDVSVASNAIYRLHGYIRASAEGGRGANLSVAGVYVFTEPVFETNGEWTEVTLYGRTGPNQKEVSVFVRLGGYSGEAIGEAWFRDVTLCRVDAVPAGWYAADLYSEPAKSSAEETVRGNGGVRLALSAAAYLILYVALFALLRKQPDALEKTSGRGSVLALLGVLAAALAARIAAALLIPGYDVDIGCFKAWADRMASVGPANFYSADYFCDYPPGYMLILWAVGGLSRLFGAGVSEWMVKLPPIVADLAMVALLYGTAKKYRLSSKAALGIAILYAFNPLVFVTGAAWGQADALMTLLLFLAVLWAVEGKWKAALPAYVAAVLFKPQALMFGPLGLAALIAHLSSNWKSPKKRAAALKDLLIGLGLTVAAAALIALPFSIHQAWDWLIALYAKTMNSYAYVTVNSCNLYFLLGKNWAGTDQSAGVVVPLLVYLLAVLPLLTAGIGRSRVLAGQFSEKRDNLRFGVLGGLAFALGAALLALGRLNLLSFANLGVAMIVYSVAVVCALYLFAGDVQLLPVFGAVLLILLFNTGTMMHERYLFPAVALLVLGYILKKDTRILWLAVDLSIAGLFNIGCALDRNIRIGGSAAHLDAPIVGLSSDMAVLEYFCSVLNCAMCFVALYLCSIFSRGEYVSLSENSRPFSPISKKSKTRKMTGKDWIILAFVTVAYAALAFTNLGSMKAPQTAFVSVSSDEEILIDLGESRIFKMAYYGGIHAYSSDFIVQVSEDGQVWDQVYAAGMKEGDCFKWKYLSSYPDGSQPVMLHGQYVRLRTDHYNLTLHELLFKDFSTGNVLPASVVSSQTPSTSYSDEGEQLVTYKDTGNETVAFLLDEQDTMEGEPGWYNSTYFDEIYHARTGYEHLHAMQTYETTHPPLGKVFISWAIAIFGMTPFGWRFAGALAGVLMLPGMYLLGKLLGKRSWAGLAAMLLMAFDLMHFTQTRIATIDSFVVLFIIWMVYFMLRWFYQDEFGLPLHRALIPLGLSGLFMGLGVASKWTACYTGVLLAIIFFYGIYRRWHLIRQAESLPPQQRGKTDKKAAEGGRKRLLITIISCLIFFVLIPMVIYYVSYIPYFAYDGIGVTPKKVIEAAVGGYFTNGEVGGMLGYHSEPGRGMDHYFYSPWYQWPVIGKPMWYASDDFEPAGFQSSIMAMGNPAVWWVGLVCILALCAVWVKRHMLKDRSISIFVEKDEPRYGIILLFYFGQLLPWVLVPRGTYIYHYFPCVPFLILATVLCLDLIADGGVAAYALGPNETDTRKPREKLAFCLMIGLLLAAFVLFIFFFPYASGITVSQEWMDAAKWFKNWLWY